MRQIKCRNAEKAGLGGVPYAFDSVLTQDQLSQGLVRPSLRRLRSRPALTSRYEQGAAHFQKQDLRSYHLNGSGTLPPCPSGLGPKP